MAVGNVIKLFISFRQSRIVGQKVDTWHRIWNFINQRSAGSKVAFNILFILKLHISNCCHRAYLFIFMTLQNSSQKWAWVICFALRCLMKFQIDVRVITVFTVFQLLTDFVCLYNYEFWLSLCKIVRSSVILLLPLCIGW
jgi:hypothetical protein